MKEEEYIMGNKPFDELFTDNSFEIIKNNVRDYFIYGYKTYSEYIKSGQTVDENYKVISALMKDKWEIKRDDNGRTQVVLKTQPPVDDNPLNSFYFYHSIGSIGDCLNYLFDLDPETRLRDPRNGIPVKISGFNTDVEEKGNPEFINLNSIEEAVIGNWLTSIQNNKEEEFPVRINLQLNIWTLTTRLAVSDPSNRYRQLKRRIDYMYTLGLVGNLKYDIDLRNEWLTERLGKDYDRKTSRKDYWYKSKLTMKNLLNNDIGFADGFTKRFLSMISFYSGHYPLGEIGALLLSRCRTNSEIAFDNVIRNKHSYIQRALYDYYLIDLLNAIENKYICLLSYSHATNLFLKEELVVPLQIRISVKNGREHLLYYNIFNKRIQVVRLEFIDDITSYSSFEKIIKKKIRIKYDNRNKNEELLETDTRKKEDIDIDSIWKKAGQMLCHIYGVGVADCYVDKDWESRLVYKENEGFEKGSLGVYEDGIFPTKELRTRIRSLYSQIENPLVLQGCGNFSIKEDVEELYNIYFTDREFQTGKGYIIPTRSELREYIVYRYDIKGKKVSDVEGHAGLFNEFMSFYSVVIADSLMDSANPDYNLEESLHKNIDKHLNYFNKETKDQAFKKIKDIIINSELVDKNDFKNTRFCSEKKNYLYEMLPLTELEIRWLLTIIDDPYAEIFITQSEIDEIKKIVELAPFKTGKFNLESLYYHDRYDTVREKRKNLNDRIINKEDLKNLRNAISAVINQNVLSIEYKSSTEDIIVDHCYIVWVEYSEMDDSFSILYKDNNNSTGSIKLSDIKRIEGCTGKKYNLKKVRKNYNRLVEKNIRKLEVEFYQGNRNLPDRILTEFSLWKKECEYDRETEKYKMSLYYHISDSEDLLNRLIMYGPFIRLIEQEDNNEILEKLKERIRIQKEFCDSWEDTADTKNS